jgi:O-antigen/teichoic acid export membrane protein
VNSFKKEWKRLSSSTLARNAGWMVAGQGSGLVLQAVYFVVLARLLGAMQYGIFVGAFAFTSLVAQYSTLGTGTVLLRYVCGDHEAFAVYWGNMLLVSASVSSLLVLMLHFLGRHLLNPSSFALVTLAALANCFFGPLTAETGRIFQAFDRMRVTAIMNLLTNLMRTLAAAGMLLTLHHATARQWAVASTMVSGIAAVIGVGTVTIQFGWPQFTPRLFLKHGMEGFGYSFASSSVSVYNDIDKTMLSHYGMNIANGIYTTAYRIVDIASIPIFSVREAALSRMFKSGRHGLVPAVELSQRLLKRTVPLGILMAVGMFVTAPLIPRMIGHEFAESVVAIRWLCLIPVFRSIHLMTGTALTGAGLQHYRTIAQVAAAGLNFGLNLWLISRYGWQGAAWSSLATDAALGVMYWMLLQVLIPKTELIEGKQDELSQSI